MADLTNFIYCLGVERFTSVDGSSENMNAMGILSVLTPEILPGTFSFSVIFTVLDIESRRSNNVRLRFYKEGADTVLVDTGTLSIPPVNEKNKINLPAKYVGINMSMDFRNIVFETEGVYLTEVTFNSVVLGTRPVYVKGKRQSLQEEQNE